MQYAEQESKIPLGRIQGAFLLQSRRLRGETDELTTSLLAIEHIAQVILFSPMAADASKSDNRWQLSRFNDMLAACAITVSPSVLPSLKSIIEKEIKYFNKTIIENEIKIFNQKVAGRQKVAERNYDISGEIEQRLRGVAAEIAVARALKTNNELSVSMPKTSGDLEGKDISVGKGDTIIHIDVKRKGSYKEALYKMVKQGILSIQDAQNGNEDGYVATTQDKDGGWKYLVNADALGGISDLKYDEIGIAKVNLLVDKLLTEVQ